MSTFTLTFSDIPTGMEDHTGTQTVNSGDTPELKVIEFKDAVTTLTYSDAIIYRPFPEGLEETEMPEVVQESWKQVQAHLSPEKQSKISYYEKNGEWFINLDGTKISLKNETAVDNPSAGINVRDSNTYFSQSAARTHAKNKGGSLPTNDLWKAMENFLGGYNQLRDILQIPLVGWVHHPDVGLLGSVGPYADLWSASDGEYLYVLSGYGHVNYTDKARSGLSVRLLDI